MNRTLAIAVSILTLALLWFYLDDNEEDRNRNRKQEQDLPAAGKSSVSSDRELPSNEAAKSEMKLLSLTMEEFKNMRDTPVEFYGQVLDQHDVPVKDVKISCSWPFMGPQHNARELLTDADGRFEVKNLKAVAIKILVYPPPGYQRLPAEVGKPRDFIQIADPPDRIKRHENYKALPQKMRSQMFIAEAYKPDKNRPMIFRVDRLER